MKRPRLVRSRCPQLSRIRCWALAAIQKKHTQHTCLSRRYAELQSGPTVGYIFGRISRYMAERLPSGGPVGERAEGNGDERLGDRRTRITKFVWFIPILSSLFVWNLMTKFGSEDLRSHGRVRPPHPHGIFALMRSPNLLLSFLSYAISSMTNNVCAASGDLACG